MIIKPMVRSNMCINSHPKGCAKETDRQIAWVKEQKQKRGTKTQKEGGKGPATVLVLGCSTGYGLASRITAAFEYGATTIGVSFEKAATQTKSGTPGYYNNCAFDKAAKKAGLTSLTFSADAFSHETRDMIIQETKKLGKKIDLIVYSLASPVRCDPDTKQLYKSVLKPKDSPYSGLGIDILSDTLKESSASPATKEEIEATVKVMGGDDWRLWINALLKADVLSKGCMTVAYSYIGPKLSHAIYRDGAIGAAKLDLEKAARDIDTQMQKTIAGRAFVSVNKGLVTRSSAVIPIISLYLSVLFKVMKQKGTHEGCIEQMERLFAERLYTGADNQAGDIPTDSENRIRIDDLEMQKDVQEQVLKIMSTVNNDNLKEVCDLAGYKHDFYAINGFDIPGIDYTADVTDMTDINY